MMEAQQRSQWKRLAAIAGLLSLLCFWTVAATHVHDAAKRSGMQQDCQLCIAGHTSHTLQTKASSALTFQPFWEPLICLGDQLPHDYAHHTFDSRAPPVSA